jgi:hypothetical protein
VGTVPAVRTPRKRFVLSSLLVGLALTAGACSSSDAATGSTTTVAAPAATSPATAGEAVFTPITASVLAPPIPVPTTDGKIHLAYELFLTNAMSQDITISSIAAESEGTVLQELSGAAMPTWMRVFGASEPTAVFGPGQSGLVWMDVIVDTEAEVPTSIEHVIEVVASAPNPPLLPATVSEVGVASTPVLDEDPVVLAPPLYGENWLDGNGCCGVSAHRGAVSPLNGALWAPERFAIDFIQLDDQDRLYSGPIDQLSSYAYYGAEIHAVAPGRVVAVVDDLPEQTPGTAPTGLPVDEYGGNHVVQDIGGGRFAFYAHIQTNGVKVEVGDELETGDVVGLLGNTGNTDAPHLHFHVMDGPDPLASNGLPFVFGSLSLVATMPDDDAIAELITSGGPARLTPGVARTEQSDVMPLYLDLMDFTAP